MAKKIELLKAPIAHLSGGYYKEALRHYTSSKLLEDMDLGQAYLLEGLLPIGGYIHLYGREKSGKSRLAWMLAHQVATAGSDWMGFKIGKPGKVLWLELDMATPEFQLVLKDAAKAGYPSVDDIILSTEHHYLNALESQAQDLLYTLQVLHKPVLTVVDTFTDSYGGDLDNETIRRVVAAFRFAVPGSAFVFVNHERRKSQALVAKRIEDDDPELGGGELSRKASGVIRLVRENRGYGKLSLKRIRTKQWWWELGLKVDENGYWRVEREAMQAGIV